MPLTVVDHPLAADLLTRLRDKRTGPAEFRSLTRRLGAILVVEATRDIPVVPVEVQTPLEPFTGSALGAWTWWRSPCCEPVLGLLDAVTDLYPDTMVGYLGLERDEETHEPRDYYAKLPPLGGRHALLLDPMLATGGSGSAAAQYVKAATPRGLDVRLRGRGPGRRRAHGGRPPGRRDRGRGPRP